MLDLKKEINWISVKVTRLSKGLYAFNEPRKVRFSVEIGQILFCSQFSASCVAVLAPQKFPILFQSNFVTECCTKYLLREATSFFITHCNLHPDIVHEFPKDSRIMFYKSSVPCPLEFFYPDFQYK